jgi:maltooligosyltrehalose trehalohydrolase
MKLPDAPGAHVQPDGATRFRVWAPEPKNVALVLESRSGQPTTVPLTRDEQGYYSAVVAGVRAGDRYRYRLDDADLADPASRFQPDGVSGPSEVVDPAAFPWTDHAWPGIALPGQIVYEMHVGTFTREGTWRAAMDRLPDLARLGITLLEVMPIGAFPGRFGWGYDGVFPYAPYAPYGRPDDLRSFVDRAHALGLGVILDVVYNHFGPDGCVHRRYAPAYFSSRANEWGDGINFDGPDAQPVRDYFCANAAHWIAEYHLDGLRLDATQSIDDRSPRHVLAELADWSRAAAGDRSIVLVAENERQDTTLLRPAAEGGYGLDAIWNDDFHHSAVVAMTGRREAYYSDHHGTPQEFVSAARHGFLFQGQRYPWQKAGRGTRTDGLTPSRFVVFLENHDQIANGDGRRLWQRTTPGRYRAMTALFLLLPGTPMLFQGQEFGSSAPFLYFADHGGELAAAVARGRAEFLRQFPSLASLEQQATLPVPHALETFERCILDWCEVAGHQHHLRLHADVIALRRREAFGAQRPVEGAVLSAEAFVFRFAGRTPDAERLLVVNLGPDIDAGGFAEPLVAPPRGLTWRLAWSSEHPDYGGGGAAPIVNEHGWRIPGHSATVLAASHDVHQEDHGPHNFLGTG